MGSSSAKPEKTSRGLDRTSSDAGEEEQEQESKSELSAETIKDAARNCKASPEQMEFLELWLKHVYDEAISLTKPRCRRLNVCTDLGHLEVCIEGPVNSMNDLLRQFVAECEILNKGMVEQMGHVLEETEVNDLTLWCRLKRIGSDKPGADSGFRVDHGLDWIVADLLMPPNKDQDLFRTHAEQELLKPISYTCTVFPVEPERRLTIQTFGAPKKALLSAFFFFKSLGFTKPEDSTVRLLTGTPANKCTITAAMGPKGLTRVVLRLWSPRRPIAEELAHTCAGFEYNKDALDQISNDIKAEPDFVDYIAEARGYTVAVGWTV